MNAESGMRVRGLVGDLGLGLRLRRDNEGIKGEDGGENMEEYLEGVHMGHVDEFVALFFGLVSLNFTFLLFSLYGWEGRGGEDISILP